MASAVIQELSKLISGITGVQLGERQFFMVETRLKKRMMDLGIQTEEEYYQYFISHQNSEKDALVSLLTTHHTSFFREFSHFEFLEREGLPRIIQAARQRKDTTLRVWSAACSTGQEVYTLSMFLKYTLPKLAPEMDYTIYGTDVSSESVAVAKNGVYQRKETKEIPLHFLADHWARGTEEISDYVKAKKSIKDPCSFHTLNLLELDTQLGNRKFDLIFCRNVFIYFTPAQIASITSAMTKHLYSEGILVIGISESLNGLNVPLKMAGPSSYFLTSSAVPATAKPGVAQVLPIRTPQAVPQVFQRPELLRVLCVDDSPSILTLLKQILKKENGFEVIGTAGNGIEAEQKRKELRPDVMTLDIHMPEQDGISYLRGNHNSSHCPVIMVTSVSRESSDLAMKALEAGAADYVEKPMLSNLGERGEEIRIKLNYAYKLSKESGSTRNLGLEQSFAKPVAIATPQDKRRVMIAGLQNQNQLKTFFKELQGAQPATIILMESFQGSLEKVAEKWSRSFGTPVQYLPKWPAPLEPGKIYLGDLEVLWEELRIGEQSHPTSILVYGSVSKKAASRMSSWENAQVLIEDTQGSTKSKAFEIKGVDQVPATSFAYMSTEYLGKAA